MTDAELETEITYAKWLYKDWTLESERRRLGRLERLQDAYDRANYWHARLNYLEGLQKARTHE